MTLVSCLIPTHDRPAMLRESIESVEAQTVKGIELLVGFDAAGIGPFAMYERMLPLTRGEYVWFFSDDDRAEPGFLESALALLRDGTPYVQMGYYLWDGGTVIPSANEGNLNSCLFRRRTLDLLRWGYGSVFPPGLHQYGDAILLFRLRRMGFLPAVDARPLVRWRVHPGQLTRSLSLRTIWDNAKASRMMDGIDPRLVMRQVKWWLGRKVGR